MDRVVPRVDTHLQNALYGTHSNMDGQVSLSQRHIQIITTKEVYVVKVSNFLYTDLDHRCSTGVCVTKLSFFKKMASIIGNYTNLPYTRFVADEDLRGRNVLLLTFYSLRELLRYPRKNLYHIIALYSGQTPPAATVLPFCKHSHISVARDTLWKRCMNVLAPAN